MRIKSIVGANDIMKDKIESTALCLHQLEREYQIGVRPASDSVALLLLSSCTLHETVQQSCRVVVSRRGERARLTRSRGSVQYGAKAGRVGHSLQSARSHRQVSESPAR